MSNSMPEIVGAETLDLILTQAIERYIEMGADEAERAIEIEWHEQVAALLTEFLFKSRCDKCDGEMEFVEMSREDGDSNYIVPMCSCDWQDEPQPTRPVLRCR